MSRVERRYVGNVQLRESNNEEGMIVEGYALKYDKWSVKMWSVVYGDFYERIERSAFDETDYSDVPVLFNHDKNLIVGRNTNSNTELRFDSVGLYFKVKLPNTTTGRDLYENVKVGNITKCSFAFTTDEDGGVELRRTEDGDVLRVIRKIDKIYDVSLVTYPAYSDTDVEVAKRDVENFSKEQELRNKKDSIRKRMLSLRYEMLKEGVNDE